MASSLSPSPSFQALTVVNGDTSTPSTPPPRSNRQQSRLPSMNISMPRNFASAGSVSSAATSPCVNSLQSSPDVLDGQDYLSHPMSPAPLYLPESATTNYSTGKHKSSKDVPASTKAPGLMRKLSQSARTGVHSTGQRLRRKASSSAHDRRDRSTGPITRRRGDSKTNMTNGASMIDLTPPVFDESKFADSLAIYGLDDLSSNTSEPLTPAFSNPEGAAPTLPDQLIRGCELTKVTRKRRKKLAFYITADGAKVLWNLGKASKQFYVDDIRDIRFGDDTQHYREDLNASPDECERWFTILYADQSRSRQERTIHLVAECKEDVGLWIDTLEALSKHRIDLMTGLIGSLDREPVIRAHWDRETAQRSFASVSNDDEESLDLPAIESLSRSLHIHCSKSTLHKQFRRADARRCGKLNYDEFKDFVRRLKERDDLRAIYRDLTERSGASLNRDRFLSFLQDVQGIDTSIDPAKWTAEFNHWVRTTNGRQGSHPSEPIASPDIMTFEAFSSFMASPSCSVYTHQKSDVRFDRPLNEYFISSSHNTYLRGRQVAGDSSTEAYISALRRGCRCVEIDCWNGAEGKPIVTHGHTGTSHVLFSDCISVISRYAFDVSPYPLVLSLEVHCDAEQQEKMVQIMKDGFGERLVVEPIHESPTQLPTPEELKYRILVKVKSSVPTSGSALASDKADVGRQRSVSSPYVIPTPLDESMSISSLPPLSMAPSTSPPSTASNPMFSPSPRSMTATSASSAEEESDAIPARSNRGGNVRKRGKGTSNITTALAALGVYLQGYKYRSLVAAECTEYNHIFSLDETKAGRVCRDDLSKAQFEDHNMRHMFRVYPKGMRLDSSNFDPNTFWRRGVQMVALNWQTYDPCMQMNQAMFAAGNDRYGYVLKPDYLRPHVAYGAANGDVGSPHKLANHLVKFSVEMISAQQLPRLRTMASENSINPFIEIQLFTAEDRARGIATGSGGTDASRNGYSGIGSPYGRRTKVILDNGYNPIFGDCFELSLETTHPDLVFVRWIVWHSPSGRTTASHCRQLAVFTAKLSSLEQGYRHLPLYNGKGEEFIFSSLFCRIQKEKSIILPTELVGNGRSERAGIMKTVTALRRTLSSDRENHKRKEAEAQKRKVMQELVEKTRRA